MTDQSSTNPTRWQHTLDLADVFHDEDRAFLFRRDVMVVRIQTSAFWDDDDMDLVTTVEDLSFTETEDEWDQVWDDFYDWADEHRVWVKTR